MSNPHGVARRCALPTEEFGGAWSTIKLAEGVRERLLAQALLSLTVRRNLPFESAPLHGLGDLHGLTAAARLARLVRHRRGARARPPRRRRLRVLPRRAARPAPQPRLPPPRRLGRAGGYRTPAARDWIEALGTNGLHRLVARPATEPIQGAAADSNIQLPGQFDPDAARREISRLHYIGLARAHVFSALIVLAALVGLGIAQDHEAARLALVTIPTPR